MSLRKMIKKLVKNMGLNGKSSKNTYNSWKRLNSYGNHLHKAMQLPRRKRSWSRKSRKRKSRKSKLRKSN